MKSKKLKFASAFLATSLLVTPISSYIIQNDNIADAYDNNINNKPIKQVLNISNKDFLKAIEDCYKNNEISKNEYDSITSKLYERRAINGQTKIVIFWDGAFDLYLNSAWSYALVGVTTIAAAAILAKAAAAVGAGAVIISGIRNAVNVMGMVISGVYGVELNRGIIIYFKRISPIQLGASINYYPSQIRAQ